MFKSILIGLAGSFLLQMGGVDTDHIFPFAGVEYQYNLTPQFAMSAEAVVDFNNFPTSTWVNQFVVGGNLKWTPSKWVAVCLGEDLGTTCYRNGDVIEPLNTHYLVFHPHLECNFGRWVITGGLVWSTRQGREAPHSFNSGLLIGVKFRLW